MNISVVIPVYNGEDTIAPCLASLLAQADSPHALEIIVADDGSRDGTRAAVAQYPGVRLISQPRNMGPAAARNRGAAEASGEILLFTDADCVPSDTWVNDMAASFAGDPKIAGVKGVYRTKQRHLTARFVQLEFEFKYERMKRQESIVFIDTYSAGYRRKVFLECGGFDTSFPVAATEDIELSFRLASQGYRMAFNPKAYVYHQHPISWVDYMKRKYKYAYWGAVVMRRYPHQIVNDSYTPITQKVQLVLAPFGVLCLCGIYYSPIWIWIAGVVWFGIGLSMMPFALLSIGKDMWATMASPLFLVPRALIQACALIGGAVSPARPVVRQRGE